jgi:hypothetical protein
VKLFILLLSLLSIINADIKLIKSESCTFNKIDTKIIDKLFMLKKTYYQNKKIIVIDSENKSVYEDFVREYLGKTPIKMKIYWTRMLFTGRKIPPKKLSIKYLENFKDNGVCHITYIDENKNPKNWKKLMGYKSD